MKFETRMKIRIAYNIATTLLGVAFVLLYIFTKSEKFMTFAIAFIACGIAQLIKNLKIFTDKEKFEKARIAETDERNVYLMHKSMSLTYQVSIYLASVCMLICYFVNQSFAANILAYVICAMLIIYLICYNICRKIS